MENSIENMSIDEEENVKSNEIVNMHIKMDLFENKPEIIQNMVLIAYQNQLANIDSRYHKYKELAGIVLWNKLRPADSFVVSLGAGTKCSSGENLRFDGVDIIDMHAEILARRGLLHYLYVLVMRELKGDANFLVKYKKNLFYVHDNFEFHLYITSAPCGDSRIFLMNSNSNINLKDAHPHRKCRGVLRTKLESGAGTIPISDKVIQSIDGIKDGKGLKVMSCSDKILKWNVLGIQGTFLSNFLKPIYLKSIVIGSIFAEDHMKRALFGRVENLKMKWPFSVNKPNLFGFQNETNDNNPVNHSFVYNILFGCEIIGSDSKLMTNIQNKYSYVCRRSLFELFIQSRLLSDSQIVQNQLYQYQKEKNAIKNYHLNKKLFFQYLSKNGLKTWLKKPVDINLFYVKT